MTRILWGSNERHKVVGYSRQTNIWLPLLKRAGYDMMAFAMTDDFPPHADEDGIPTFGKRWEPYGNDIYAQHMEFLRPDFSLGLYNGWLPDPAIYRKYAHAQWEPVDSEPMRPKILPFLKVCRWVIAMSRFGERVMRNEGLDPLYVPHGIDGKVFFPSDRTAARAQIQTQINANEKARGFKVELGDKFLVVMNGANFTNPARKGWFEALKAFKLFHQVRRDSVLYLHTCLNDPNGVDLKHDIEVLGLPLGSVVYPNQYFYTMGMIPDSDINALYNAADVFFHPSHTEGFGLPVAEAEMAGCPTIVTDASAMSEVGDIGIKVPAREYEALSGWYWTRPDVADLVQALEMAYQGKTASRAETAVWAQRYEAEHVLNTYMLPALKQIGAELTETTEERYARQLGERRQVTVNGVTLTVRPGMWDQAIARTVQTEYFPDIIDYTKIKRAVDVGAHIGAWALWVKQQSPDAKIVAIEAMPENAALCRQNCNGKNADSITVLEGMCSYTPGEYDVLVDPTNSGGQTFVRRDMPTDVRVATNGEDYAIRRAYEGGQYKLMDAMMVFNFDGKPDILKLDCEGGEYDILNNAPPEDLTAFRWIVGEYHNELGDITATLKRLEPWFTVRALRKTDDLFGLFCLERKDNVTA